MTTAEEIFRQDLYNETTDEYAAREIRKIMNSHENRLRLKNKQEEQNA